MSSELTTRQAAEATGVPFSILTRWLDEVPVPHRRDDLGQRKFGPEGLAVIERVKSLRLDDGRAVESIRAILGPLPPLAGVTTPDMAVLWAPDEAPRAGAPTAAAVAPPAAMPTAADIAVHVGIVVADVMRREAELAEVRLRLAVVPARTPRPWWRIWG